MNKLGVVLGVAAVATIVGCKDADYKTRRLSAQDEVKTVETVPAKDAPETETKQAAATPGEEVVQPTEEAKPVEPEYTIYIVQRGDYLAKISKKYNLKIEAIKQLNNMKNDKIKLGQKIKLPGKIDVGEQTVPAGAMAEAPKPVAKEVKPYQGETEEYVVKSGDTLGAIAYGRGIKIRQLKQLNNLKNDSLRVGQKLKVPVGKSAPAKTVKAETAKPVEPAVDVESSVAPVEPVPAEAAPAAPAEATAAAAAEAVPSLTYVVKEGEDIIGISVDWGVSAAAICELNNLSENDALTPGQVIKLPPEAQK